MAFTNPTLLHSLLTKLADNIAIYADYQIQSGAQVIQVFDSWASCLTPQDFDEFSLKYIQVEFCHLLETVGRNNFWYLSNKQKVISKVKAKHPTVPIILYIRLVWGVTFAMNRSVILDACSKSAALLEKMAVSGADIISLDWTVGMKLINYLLVTIVNIYCCSRWTFEMVGIESTRFLLHHRVLQLEAAAAPWKLCKATWTPWFFMQTPTPSPHEPTPSYLKCIQPFRWHLLQRRRYRRSRINRVRTRTATAEIFTPAFPRHSRGMLWTWGMELMSTRQRRMPIILSRQCSNGDRSSEIFLKL